MSLCNLNQVLGIIGFLVQKKKSARACERKRLWLHSILSGVFNCNATAEDQSSRTDPNLAIQDVAYQTYLILPIIPNQVRPDDHKGTKTGSSTATGHIRKANY